MRVLLIAMASVCPSQLVSYLTYLVEAWLSGSVLVSINVVVRRRARLIPGWLTGYGG